MKRCKADLDNLYGYRIKLYPTDAQKERMNLIMDLYRYVYNWTLSQIEMYYEITGQFMNINDACKLLRDHRNSTEWLKEIPVNTARHAIMSAYASYSIFFKKKANHPKFISKKDPLRYFKIRGERIYLRDRCVGFEGLGRRENIDCKNYNIPKSAKLYNCAVIFDGYNYWLCVCIEKHTPMEFDPDCGPIGIDLGLRKLAVLSDGTVYKLPDTSKYLKRRKKIQRQMTKDLNRRKKQAAQVKTKLDDIPYTKNMLKHKKQYREVCNRITNIKHTYIHTMTSEIVNKNPSAIVLETLNVRGMMKNKYLGKYLSRSMFSEIGRQLEYKSKRNPTIKVIYADRWYPSSQICSGCGFRQNIGDTEIYRCPICGLVIDRDLNAAINLSRVANG